VGDYQHLGILPSAMANFLALLGWSPGGDREVMTEREMIDLFSADGLLRKASVFDMKKLEWMNGQHLSLIPLETLLPIVNPLVVQAGLATADELEERRVWWCRLLELLRVRARTTHDIVRQAAAYFRDEIAYDPEATQKTWQDAPAVVDLLRGVRESVSNAEWTEPALEAALRGLAEARGTSAGRVFQPLRVALTGQMASPGIFDVLLALGRDRSLRRIDDALARLTAADG
jgi:glutamyl-tRNA synthetase